MRFTSFLRSLLHFHNIVEWDAPLMEAIKRGCTISVNFVTVEEEKNILNEIEPHMKRLKYEKSHWDDAIHLYREREQRNWRPENALVIERIQNESFTAEMIRSSHVHILDLHQDGHIRPHIDSERVRGSKLIYCGEIVTGVSLMSNCVMRLRHAQRKELIVDMLLKRLSLYKLSGPGRYEFTHEILANDESKFDGKRVERGRRISIICRDIPRGKPSHEEIIQKRGQIELEDQ